MQDTDAAVRKANDICAAVKAPIRLHDATLRTTIGVGVAIASVGSDPGRLLADADAALYDAKAAGRDQVVIDTSSDARTKTL